MDLRTNIKVPTWGGMAFSSITFGAGFVALERFVPGLGYGSWRYDLPAAAVATLVWAFLLTRGQNRKQKAVLLAEGTMADADDDSLDA